MAYFVTQIRDKKFRKIAGPFATKEEAEGAVSSARERVCAVDPWSHFDSFGTAMESTQR